VFLTIILEFISIVFTLPFHFFIIPLHTAHIVIISPLIYVSEFLIHGNLKKILFQSWCHSTSNMDIINSQPYPIISSPLNRNISIKKYREILLSQHHSRHSVILPPFIHYSKRGDLFPVTSYVEVSELRRDGTALFILPHKLQFWKWGYAMFYGILILLHLYNFMFWLGNDSKK